MSPILDEAKALENVGGDRELLLEMIELFAVEKPKDLAEIEAALASRDAAHLRFYVHHLKGGAMALAAMETQEIAYDIEIRARDGNWDGMETAIQSLLDALARLQPELDRLADPL